MRDSKNIVKFIIVGLLALGAVGYIFFQKDNNNLPEQTAETTETKMINSSVRLGWVHQAEWAGFYVAKQKNYFADRGVDLTINPGGIDLESVKMVANGTDTFGVTTANKILIARSQGIPVVAVAAVFRKNPYVLFSLKEKNIVSPADLKGKRMGIKIGSSNEFTYRGMLAAAGLNTGDFVEVPVKDDMNMLFTDKVDVWGGYIINDVIAAERKLGDKVNIIKPSDFGLDYYNDILFTTEKTISEQPDLVRGVVSGLLDGWEYAYNNATEAAQITLSQAEGMDPEHQQAMMQSIIDNDLLKINSDGNPGLMTKDAWDTLNRALVTQKIIESEVDTEKAFTNQFISTNE